MFWLDGHVVAEWLVDSVKVHGGRDHMFGGEGDDILIGQQGKDRLDGGPGDDLLIQGCELDKLLGSGLKSSKAWVKPG